MANELTNQEWYELLIEDCKAILVETEFTSRWSYVEGYHQIGERILADNFNFEREKIYGKDISQRVGKSLGKSRTTIDYAIAFAKHWPQLDKTPYGKALSWHRVCNELLPGVTEEDKQLDSRPIVPYGENIFYLTAKWQDRHSDFIYVDNKEPLPTLKRRSWFYHKDTKAEFSLRDYARVQEFPDSFKFVGTYEKIKDQIGNAVPPKMAKFVGEKLHGKTFGDLFAGCGGLSCGLEMLGKKSVWAVERSIDYARTYTVNHPHSLVVTKDIRELNPKDFSAVDIIIGGPPCQGFSLSGKRFKDDPRNELYKEFVRFVSVLKPHEFLLENVPQIREAEKEITSEFEKVGYQVQTQLIKGEEIGMRQMRHRFFFYGNN